MPDDAPPKDPTSPKDPTPSTDPIPPKDPTPPKDPPKENDPKDPKEPKGPEKSQEPKEPKNSKAPKLFRKQKPVVIVPLCFGPCTQFPPAPPYRQFAEEAAPEPVVEPAPAEPIRPLWMKSDALDDAVAKAYLERTLQHIAQGQSDGVVFDADADAVFIEVEGVRYREIINPHSLLFTNEVNQPAVNAWVRGFGGVNSNGAAGHRYADFDNGGALSLIHI